MEKFYIYLRITLAGKLEGIEKAEKLAKKSVDNEVWYYPAKPAA
jgi:hypothetical protein